MLFIKKEEISYIFDGKIIKRELMRTPGHSLEQQYLTEKNWIYKENDIICLTYPKTGQTMLLQMMNMIRSKGESTGSLLSEVVWPFRAELHCNDLENQPYNPRVFKSHRYFNYYNDKLKCKFIGIVRDPVKTLYSYRQFLSEMPHLNVFPTYYFFQIDWFVWYFFLLKNYNIYEFYAQYWALKEREDVLILCYEDVIEDPVLTIKIVAQFMEVKLTNEEIEKVKSKTSKEYMLTNSDLFNGKHEHEKAKEKGYDVYFSSIAKTVTSGQHQSTTKASSRSLRKLDNWWNERLESKLGIKNYADYRQKLKEFQKGNIKYQVSE